MITYQQEFLYLVEGYDELLSRHWEEIALNKDKINLSPDWEAYLAKEEAGETALFTVRDDNKLVGYFLVFIGRHIHYQDHVFAQNDVIYVAPEYRKGFTGIKLIKFAEKCLKEDGVSVIQINTKFHKDFGSILKRLGYVPTDTIYGKYVGEE